MNPDQAVANREASMAEFDRIIDYIMDDEEVDYTEACRRYDANMEHYLKLYDRDDDPNGGDGDDD